MLLTTTMMQKQGTINRMSGGSERASAAEAKGSQETSLTTEISIRIGPRTHHRQSPVERGDVKVGYENDHRMHSFREQRIDDAIAELGLDSTVCRKLGDDECEKVVARVVDRFVDSSGTGRVWWERLRYRVLTVPEPEDVSHGLISGVLPRGVDRSVFFIPDRDDGFGNPVYVVAPQALDRILGETAGYEYYIVSMKLDWLVAVTDHNQLIKCSFSGDPE